MKHLKEIALLSLMFTFGCDRVKQDDPSIPITLETLRYARENSPMIIPIWGDFNEGDVTVLSSSSLANQVRTEKKNNGVRFVKYLPGSSSDLIDFQVLQNEALLGNGSVEIRLLGDNDCTDTGFSDHHQIAQGESLEVDLMENDAFCNFIYTGTGGVRFTDIEGSNSEGVLISITARTAVLTYTPPPGFSGHVEFIYELCYGSSIGKDFSEEVLSDPLNECQFYYVALTTIDVI